MDISIYPPTQHGTTRSVITRGADPLGYIEGGTAYLTSKASSVLKGQIRKVWGDEELKFSAADAPEEGELPDEPIQEAAPLPPEPPRDPMAGDKTPALIEWRRRHWKPERFQATYAHRGIF